MVTIQLSEEEAECLKRLLDWTLSDLRMEIGRTERQAFREKLKTEKAVLQKVLSQLDGAEE
jgi:hypothetical protein